MNKIKGFTLIELIMVIVILGALSAIAIPRYIDLQSQARIASLEGLRGGLNSAVAIVRAGYYANGKVSPVTLDNGSTIAVGTTGAAKGVPLATAAAIGSALDYQGFVTGTTTATTIEFDFSTAITNCNASYDQTAGVTSLTTTGC